VLTHFEVF